MRAFFLFGMLIISGLCFGQNHKLSGTIRDHETQLPVPGASVTRSDGQGTITDANGFFSLMISSFPATFVVSHVSYERTEVSLPADPKKPLTISLHQKISDIPEVQISAKRMRILTEDSDFSLLDIACGKEILWMLGFIRNHHSQGRLWQANLYGDTIRSLPVAKPEELFTDPFGNVHLLTSDSAYQLFNNGTEILLLYSSEKASFLESMDVIKVVYADKMVYQDYLPDSEGLQTRWISTDSHKKGLLCSIRDSAEEARQTFEYIYGKDMYLYHLARSELLITRIEAKNQIRFNRLTQDSVFNRNVKVPVFATDDSLYLVNLYKDSLNVYDDSGVYAGSRHINFHRDSILFDVSYRSIRYLKDPVTQNIFLLIRRIASWDLIMLDLPSGKPGRTVPLPDFPGMTSIQVHGNAVYFLYAEKDFPFYNRLYRYQLE